MSDTKLCPFCGEDIKTAAIKCKHCGSMLSGNMSDPGTSESQVSVALAEKYEIIEAVGKGGMATVYKAIQKNLNRFVALKVVHQNLIHDAEFLSRFHREAQTGASLNHPNIVKIYDEGNLNGVHYIAMEYLEGMDLHDILQNEVTLDIERVIKYIAPIADALDYVHQIGLIHRDVKTANILVTNDGRPVLTDFGIAHAASGTKLTQAGSVIGTPEYMSPEQAQGEPIDGRSDIFGLGIVLFECLTGKVPFKGDNPLTTIHGIIYDETPSLKTLVPKIPNWIDQLLQKTLEKSLDKRIPSAHIFSICLFEKKAPTTTFIKKQLLLKPESNTTKYSSRKGSGQKFLILLITFFGLIIVGATIMYISGDGLNLKSQIFQEKEEIVETQEVFQPDVNKILREADVAMEKEKFDIALMKLEDALKIDPANQMITDKINTIHAIVKKNNSQIALQELIKSADKKYGRNNFRGARIDYGKVLSEDPANKHANERLVLINEKINEIEKDSRNSEYLKNLSLADSFYNADNFIVALSYYEEALKIKPNNEYLNEQIFYSKLSLEEIDEEFERIIINAEMKAKERKFQQAIDVFKSALLVKNDKAKIQSKIDSLQYIINDFITREINNNLVFVSGNSFAMGSNQSAADEKPEHQVRLSGFYIDKYEVTVKQYKLFCEVTGREITNQASNVLSDGEPIVNISWSDANAFARWAGKRLPTEAEWEYAAKGGVNATGFRYSGDNNYSRVAVYSGNSSKYQKVGTKKANELGIFDMSGNVWEWCYDRYSVNYYSESGNSLNPKGPSTGNGRVIRGGAYDSSTRDLMVKNRSSFSGNSRNNIGFRCVLTK